MVNRVKVHNDQLTVSLNVKDAPPDISYWQPLHGLAVAVKALAATFFKAFNGQDLDFDKCVLLIQGVWSDMALPAHITLPIACGKIVRTHPLTSGDFSRK